MKLKEFWEAEAKMEKIYHEKFKYELVIEIKNHSPYNKKFLIYGKAEGDPEDVIKFYLYTGLNSKRTITVDHYSKSKLRIYIPDVKVNFVLFVEDEKGNKKEFTFSVD